MKAGVAGLTGRPKMIAIGRVVSAFGRRGEVKVLPLTDFPERFSVTARVYVGGEAAATPYGEGLAAFGVERSRPHKGAVLLKLSGVDSIGEAEKLRGKLLWVPEEEAWPLPKGHYWVHDVIGLRVFSTDGHPVGRVEEVIRTPANDVYVVRNGGRETLIPAVKEAVQRIDLEEGVMTVSSSAGMVEGDEG